MAKKRRRGKRGQGSVFQRDDGRWVAALAVGKGLDKRTRYAREYFDSEEDARKWLSERLQERGGGQQPDVDKRTVGWCVDFWLDNVKRPQADKFKEETYLIARQRVDDYLKPCLGGKDVRKLTDEDVAGLYQAMQAEGKSRSMQGKVGTLLRSALDYAVSRGWCRKNVAKVLPLPSQERRQIDPLNAEEVRQFLAEARRHRLWPLWALALDTGMRMGEIIGLKWSNVDLERGQVLVVCSVNTRRKGPAVVSTTKTKSSTRVVKLTGQTLAALRRLRRENPTHTLVFPTRGQGPNYGRGDRYRRAATLRRTFAKLLKKAKVRQVRFHDLRHTHATLSLLAGQNVLALSRRLGHSKVEVTLRHYGHWLPAMEGDLVAYWDGVLGAAQGRSNGHLGSSANKGQDKVQGDPPRGEDEAEVLDSQSSAEER
jgi:integrase